MKLIEIVDKLGCMHWIAVNDDQEEKLRDNLNAHAFVVSAHSLPLTTEKELLEFLDKEQQEALQRERHPEE